MAAHARYPQLFSPIRLGTLELPNRIVMPAMYTAAGAASGHVSDWQLRYYEARAAGGVGLIVTELTAVHPFGFGTRNCMRLDDDRFIEGHRRLTDVVHAAGSLIASQLCHQGRMVPAGASGHVPVGPSPVPAFRGDVPRPLGHAEIANIVDHFAAAAVRARDAGYDAVELHMAHGYLIHAFLSPLANLRTDEYGGDEGRRARFALEVVAAVREAMGDDFPLLVKLAVEDGGGIGYTKDEGASIAGRLAAAGVDAITASTGAAHGEELTLVPPMTYARGFNVRLAEALRAEQLSIPVGALGRIATPDDAEAILASGRADFVAMGRAFIADPDWPAKALEGRAEEITPCIGCLQGCYDRQLINVPIGCMTNPRVGRESTMPWVRVARPLRVLVVGGGVAGMQAAVTAARRGHEVSLWERSARLGGQWRSAAAAPGKEEFERFREHLEAELQRRGVAVSLSREVSADAVTDGGFEAVIVAVGAAVETPSLPGDGSVPLFDVRAGLHDAFEAGDVPGGHVVVLGAEPATWEAANWLVARVDRVTLLSERSSVARDAGDVMQRLAEQQLKRTDVRVLVRTALLEVRDGALVVERGGQIEVLPEIDAVVVAGTRTAQPALVEELEASGVRTLAVGDAREPRNAFEAVQEAFAAAYDL